MLILNTDPWAPPSAVGLFLRAPLESPPTSDSGELWGPLDWQASGSACECFLLGRLTWRSVSSTYPYLPFVLFYLPFCLYLHCISNHIFEWWFLFICLFLKQSKTSWPQINLIANDDLDCFLFSCPSPRITGMWYWGEPRALCKSGKLTSNRAPSSVQCLHRTFQEKKPHAHILKRWSFLCED